MDQAEMWNGEFGSDYFVRNNRGIAERSRLYIRRYGQSREAMNAEFIHRIGTDARILEVGCGSGEQLRYLSRAEFNNLYGLDVCREAVMAAQSMLPCANILHGYAEDLPFRDNFFDMVFTSGLLIHVPSEWLDQVMGQIVRCTNRYVWGFEYFALTEEEILYRGEPNLLWKRDHAWLFQKKFGLLLLQEKFYRHGEQPLYDTMYLLEKP